MFSVLKNRNRKNGPFFDQAFIWTQFHEEISSHLKAKSNFEMGTGTLRTYFLKSFADEKR
jgi:hypothetical protein